MSLSCSEAHSQSLCDKEHTFAVLRLRRGGGAQEHVHTNRSPMGAYKGMSVDVLQSPTEVHFSAMPGANGSCVIRTPSWR